MVRRQTSILGQVYHHILIVGLAERNELRLSAISTWASHKDQVVFEGVDGLLCGGSGCAPSGPTLLNVVLVYVVLEQGFEVAHVLDDLGADLEVSVWGTIHLVTQRGEETIAFLQSMIRETAIESSDDTHHLLLFVSDAFRSLPIRAR
jgi:hypothetical protein